MEKFTHFRCMWKKDSSKKFLKCKLLVIIDPSNSEFASPVVLIQNTMGQSGSVWTIENRIKLK